MKKFLPFLLIGLFLTSCGTIGSIDRQTTSDLFEPAAKRVEAYAASSPGSVPESANVLDQIAKVRDTIAAAGDAERIPAAGLAEAVTVVADAHDHVVALDTTLDAQHRDTYLMTTNILRRIFVEALTAAPPSGPSP